MYTRRRGVRGEPFRFILSEKPVDGEDALIVARETVRELQREFPDYQYLLVIVRWVQGKG